MTPKPGTVELVSHVGVLGRVAHALALTLTALVASPSHALATPFAADSVWNAPLPAKAALDPRSTALVAEFKHQLSTTNPWIATTTFSTPIYTVPAHAPTVPVVVDGHSAMFSNYTDRWNLTHEQFSAVPLPINVRPAAGTDGRVAIYQPSTDTLWEIWQLRLQSDLKWHASWGGRITGVSGNPGFFEPGQFGATASGLSLLGGTIRASELRAGQIDHALEVSIPHPLFKAIWSWPAQRSDGDNLDLRAIPEGARFRLDPKLDIPSLNLPPATEAIAEAVQHYGLIVVDKGGCICFFAEDPSPLGNNPYPSLFGGRRPDQLLASFPWSRLQALKLRLNRKMPLASRRAPGRRRSTGN